MSLLVFAAGAPHWFSGAPASPNSLIDFFEEGKLFCIVCQAGLNLGAWKPFDTFLPRISDMKKLDLSQHIWFYPSYPG